MAAALECWSGRGSPEEEVLEQVLVSTRAPRSELLAASPPAIPKEPSKWQRLGRNVAGAINNLKSSLSIDLARDGRDGGVWGGVVQSLARLYPGSQLPERLVCSIRKHFDSLPASYGQADFDMKEVFLHMRLLEQSSSEDQPAISIEEISENQLQGSLYRLTFASCGSISLPTVSGALDSTFICCKKVQVFEKKSITLGIVLILVQSGQEKFFKSRIESALKPSLKKPKFAARKLSFGLCGCQEGNPNPYVEAEFDEEEPGQGFDASASSIQLQLPLRDSTFFVRVDEWQTVQSGGDAIRKWLLSPECIEFTDQVGPFSFKGLYKGKRVGIEKLRGCERGTAYEVAIRQDLLELMTCGHRNVLYFHGICIDENHGLCVVTKLMEGGCVNDILQKRKKIPIKEVTKITMDVAEGIKFMNDHGVPYRDLNLHKILLDRQGNACLGDMGIVTTCNNLGDVTEYETAGYRWLAPEVIAGDPENVTETWMSNAYSFGMILWELITCEVAYGAFSPVQAAVGIAACGLRPEIPRDCPMVFRTLMNKCWNSSSSKRPQFDEILSMLSRANSAGRNS